MLAKALGVNQLLVVVNKLDATDPPWSEERYEAVKAEVGPFLARTGFRPKKVSVLRVTGGVCLTVVILVAFEQMEGQLSVWGFFRWNGRIQTECLGGHFLVAVLVRFRPADATTVFVAPCVSPQNYPALIGGHDPKSNARKP